MGMTGDGLAYWQAESEGIELLEMTIGDFLDRQAKELAEQEAVVYSGYPEFGPAFDFRWTYRDYRDQADRVAKGLIGLGFAKGDHIAVLAANVPEWILLAMAAAKAGLPLVAINPVLQAEEVEYILKQGDVQALFFMPRVRDADHLATVRALTTPGANPGEVTSKRLPKLRYVCLIGPLAPGALPAEGWRPALFDEVRAAGSEVSDAQLADRQRAVTPRDPAMIMYTSGTTGRPKGAMLTHRNLLNDAWLLARRWGIRQADHCLSPMPLFHAGGSVCAMLANLATGSAYHPLIAFDPLKFLQTISRERCAYAGGVPTMLLAALQHPDFAQYDLSALRSMLSGGSPVPVAVMEQVHDRMGAEPGIVYGMTESSAVISETRPDDPFALKAGTCGVPLPHTDVKVADPATGQTLRCGERGEICAHGFLVMAGYYNMPEKTAETIDAEGWLHTGDLGVMDTSGHITVAGRVKDMVIRGGENLFPAEIEAFLIRHPKVSDAQVVGVPDAFFGEELLAAIIPTAGETLTEQELRDYCQGQISHQKIPRYFQFVEVYPLTASGKVQKFVLREWAIKALGLEEVANTQTV
jgi:fatty-acyl-CoA synthase